MSLATHLRKAVSQKPFNLVRLLIPKQNLLVIRNLEDVVNNKLEVLVKYDNHYEYRKEWPARIIGYRETNYGFQWNVKIDRFAFDKWIDDRDLLEVITPIKIEAE